jgi:hypothetical protein
MLRMSGVRPLDVVAVGGGTHAANITSTATPGRILQNRFDRGVVIFFDRLPLN